MFEIDTDKEPVFDINQISKLLPHRYPFILVDKVLELNENEITSIKNVTINEPFFQGHFPNKPIMPGVLQVEALVQNGGILGLQQIENPNDYLTYFLGIDKCKFRKMVVPGDTLILKCKFVSKLNRGIMKIEGKAYVGKNLACQAVMTAMISKKKDN